MVFIPFNDLSPGQTGGGNAGEGLVRQTGGFNAEQAYTFHAGSGALQAFRVVYRMAQPLIAAAEAQDATSPPDMGLKVDIPTRCPNGREVSHGGLGAGNYDKVCIAGNGLVQFQKSDGNARFEAQRVEIIKIGDAGQFKNAYFV